MPSTDEPAVNPATEARAQVEALIPEHRRAPGWADMWAELEVRAEVPIGYSAMMAGNMVEGRMRIDQDTITFLPVRLSAVNALISISADGVLTGEGGA